MSLPEDVNRLLNKAAEEYPEMLPDTPENAEANNTLLLEGILKSIVAVSDALMLVAHEVEHLRRSIGAPDRPPGTS